MKIFITTSSLLIVGITLFFFMQSYFSRAYAAPGLVAEQPSKCPSTPNCICSEYSDDTEHFFDPIEIPISNGTALTAQLKNILKKMGASSISTSDSYIAATFTSAIFRFVDDFEIRIDNEKQLIHIRSASRTGKSDFGVNKKRADTFSSLIKEL